jgi:hypothetical protein
MARSAAARKLLAALDAELTAASVRRGQNSSGPRQNRPLFWPSLAGSSTGKAVCRRCCRRS